MNARTDIHRRGAIDDTAYRYVFSYSGATTQGGFPIPEYGIDCTIDFVPTLFGYPQRVQSSRTHAADGSCCIVGMRLAGVPVAAHGSTFKCTVCGAGFVYGDVWAHGTTGEHIFIGHDCADKMGSSRPGMRRAFEYRRATFAERQFKAGRARAFCMDHPGLADALLCDHRILKDMASRLNDYGTLSQKQIEFAVKLVTESKAPKVEAPVVQPITLPAGRATYNGKFVSMKTYESDWGVCLKGLFIVAKDGGEAKIWMSVPSPLQREDLGKDVQVAVTLEQKDPGFHIGKRPTVK